MIVDNRAHKQEELQTKFNDKQWALLRDRLSHQSVKELCEDKNNPNLLIFPHCLNNRR